MGIVAGWFGYKWYSWKHLAVGWFESYVSTQQYIKDFSESIDTYGGINEIMIVLPDGQNGTSTALKVKSNCRPVFLGATSSSTEYSLYHMQCVK